MILTIVSSDKVALSMFSDFYKSLYCPEIKQIDLICLYSEEFLKSSMEDLKKISDKKYPILIRYKTKITTKNIPSCITDNSDTVIKFDIFSTEPEIMKSGLQGLDAIIDRWKMNIEKFNGVKI